MKYLRTYPFFMQVLLFLLLAFTMFWFATVLTIYFTPKLSGQPLEAVRGATAASSAVLMRIQFFASQPVNAGLFLLPAVLFAYLAHPRPAAYLRLQKPGRPAQWLAVALITAGMIPLLSALQELVQRFPFSEKVVAEQQATTRFFVRLISEAPAGTFLGLFLCIAVLTAVQEELFFRGIILRFVHKSTHRTLFAILASTTLFTLMHLNQPLALASVFVAGLVLGLVYRYTRSLWLSMWMHFLFNGTEVMMMRYSPPSPDVAQSATPWWLVAAGAGAFAAGWYWLYQVRTPLPANWSDDYAPVENGQQWDMDQPSAG